MWDETEALIGCSTVLEPSHPHSNWFRAAQVRIRGLQSVSSYVHPASVQVQYG